MKTNKKKFDFEDKDEVKPSQFARLHGLSVSLVKKLCREGRIEGARKVINKYWVMRPKARIKWTDKQKIKRMTRALRCYGNMDMWAWGKGAPIVYDKKYGYDQEGDGVFYNLFCLHPAQDGWNLANETLIEVGEK